MALHKEGLIAWASAKNNGISVKWVCLLGNAKMGAHILTVNSTVMQGSPE